MSCNPTEQQEEIFGALAKNVLKCIHWIRSWKLKSDQPIGIIINKSTINLDFHHGHAFDSFA